jgi:hypothetical protein
MPCISVGKLYVYGTDRERLRIALSDISGLPTGCAGGRSAGL